MRKIVIRKPGSYDRLEIQEAPDPVPQTGEVLIQVHASGVNYADCVIRMGLYQSAKEFVGWPITPGFEFSGVVVGRGPGATRFKEGERVLGVMRFGAYASHVCVSEALLFPMPKSLSFEQAAGFPVVFMTAYHPLHQLLRIREGEKLLIHSAAGGVGGALVQVAKHAGGLVIGVVGASHKVDTAKSHGADIVIDKSREDLWARVKQVAPDGLDIVLDANGVATLRGSFQSLAPAGKLVIYGAHSMLPRRGGRPNYLKLLWDYLRTPRYHPLRLTNDNKSVLAFNLSYLFHRIDFLHEAMTDMMKWLNEGSLRPLPVKSFPFENVAEAHRALESGQTTGKLVLTFDASGV